MSMQAIQEAGHGTSHDYRAGSPHLKHWALYDGVVSLLESAIRNLHESALPLTVLEVGAGHGGFTEPALAAGCRVTATEMSRPSMEHLKRRFGSNPLFDAVFESDGSLDAVEGRTYSLILCAAVLHHIPDYISFLKVALTHLSPGGTLITIADPLWYPRVGPATYYASRAAYYAWRVTQGDYIEGAKTRIRRLRGIMDETHSRDMVEYHVNRSGVDENAILAALTPLFSRVRLMPYWSTQSASLQKVGELVGLNNNFGLLAESFIPHG